MVRARLMGSVLFLAVAAGCAGTSQQVKAPAAQAKTAPGTAVAKKDDQKVICRMERPTGSNIPERVCSYPDAKSDEDTARTQDMLRAAQGRSGPTTGN